MIDKHQKEDKTVLESQDKTILERDKTIRETDDQTVAESDDPVVEQRQETSTASEISSFRDCQILHQLPATGGEADIYLIKQENKDAILKLYRLGIDPKEEVLKKAKELSDQFPEHIIGIYEHGYDDKTKRWYEIQEHAKYGSLRDYIDAKAEKKELKTITEEIVEGLKVLNDNNLLHLDLKPSNILIRSKQPLDLIFSDFGIASIISPEQSKKEMSKLKGTVLYWAPESLAGFVGKPMDYWSLGVIILEMLAGTHPFSGLDTRVIMYTLSTKGVHVPDDLPEDYKPLLKGLLTREPEKRWSYSEVRRWLNGEKDIPVYYAYEERREGQYEKPYPSFNEKKYYSLEDLVAAFVESEESWKDAIKHVNRGYITKWLENNEDYDNSVTIEKIREETGRDNDLVLLKIIYTFNKELPFVFHGKLITLQNLHLYAGKTLRKENTKAEEEVTDALLYGKLLKYYEEYLNLTSNAKKDLYKTLASIHVAISSKNEYQDKLTLAIKVLDTTLNNKHFPDEDAGLTKAIYTYYPDKPFKTHSGVECETLEDIGDAIEKERPHYINVLLNNTNSNLYTFLELKGIGKKKILQYINPSKNDPVDTFNRIVLELQGNDKLKLDDLVFYKPEDMLRVNDDIKARIIKMLANPISKLSIWLEQYSQIKENILKWRMLGRHNLVTLSYALEDGSPFHFKGNTVFGLEEFKNVFATHIKSDDFLNEINTSISFIQEADFWLQNYQNTRFLDVVTDYFKELVQNTPTKDKKNIADCLATFIVNDYKKRVNKDVFEQYWNNLKSIIDTAHENGFISDVVYSEHIAFLLNSLEELTKQAVSATNPGLKKKYVDEIRTIKHDHHLAIRQEKEKELYEIQVKTMMEKLEAEKIQKIMDADNDIDQEIKKKKRDIYDKESKVDLDFGEFCSSISKVGKFIGAGFYVVLVISVFFSNVVEAIGFVLLGIIAVPFYAFIGWVIGFVIGTILFPIAIIVMKLYKGAKASKSVYRSSDEDHRLVVMKQIIDSDFKRQKNILGKNILKDIYNMTEDNLNDNLNKQQKTGASRKISNKKNVTSDSTIGLKNKAAIIVTLIVSILLGIIYYESHTLKFKGEVKKQDIVQKIGYTTAYVNFRSGPGTENELVGVLQKKTRVIYIGTEKAGNGADWYKVKVESGALKGNIGYVSYNYLKF